MNTEDQYEQKLDRLLIETGTYAREAYYFVRNAVSFTVAEIEQQEQTGPRHVTGQELLEGIRSLALQQFGPLALHVLHQWGIAKTEDFGQIVFNMVNHELLGSTENDSIHDFDDGYCFEDAFLAPFAADLPSPDELPKIV